jgi:hypothetical protein
LEFVLGAVNLSARHLPNLAPSNRSSFAQRWTPPVPIRLRQYALHVLLAVAGGSFLYLGAHAVHGEWRRSGIGPTFVPALTGVAGPSVLRLFRYLA